MTREEAIKNLKTLLLRADMTDEYGDMIDISPYDDAVDMAIKALEQEPCGDAISRQATLKKLNTKTHEYGRGLGYRSEWVELIKSMPPVSPARLTGWIPVKFRPLTEEEQIEYPDYCYMADCQMPDEGDEILVSTAHGTVEKDIAEFDDGFYLDSGYDWQTDIVAWRPLPERYKAESEDKG